MLGIVVNLWQLVNVLCCLVTKTVLEEAKFFAIIWAVRYAVITQSKKRFLAELVLFSSALSYAQCLSSAF